MKVEKSTFFHIKTFLSEKFMTKSKMCPKSLSYFYSLPFHIVINFPPIGYPRSPERHYFSLNVIETTFNYPHLQSEMESISLIWAAVSNEIKLNVLYIFIYLSKFY